MNWNQHSNLDGLHAFLSGSKYHWLRYNDDKIAQSYFSFLAAKRGTELHAFAEQCIKLGQKLPRSNRTLNMYVNDAIGFGMRPEQPLFYSVNCFGTADAISFKGNLLRIHDLKTGVSETSMDQLMIYEALFCLEYNMSPSKINSELRIYQNDEIAVFNPTVEDILPITDRIITADKIINKIKEEGGDNS